MTVEEPPNGTAVAVQAHGRFCVWIRDDKTAHGQIDPDARWFCGAAYSLCSQWNELADGARVYLLQPMNTLPARSTGQRLTLIEGESQNAI